MTSEVHTTPSASKKNNRRVAIISAALVAGLLGSGALVLRGTEAVFSANTTNGVNTWQAGSVSISDDDSGQAMFQAPAMAPGDSLTRCINVTYTGNVAAPVRLYATNASGDLRPDLNLTITEGTGATDVNCNNFVADGAPIYTGNIHDFTTDSFDHETGVSSWTPNSNPTVRTFQFVVQLDSLSTLQGQNAQATFVWEAQAGS